MSYTWYNRPEMVPAPMLSAWLDSTGVTFHLPDTLAGTVSVPRYQVTRTFGGGPTLSDFLVTKRLPPGCPSTIMFMDAKSMPLVPTNPGDPGLYLHYAPPGDGGLVSSTVHLMVKTNEDSNYVYMGTYDINTSEDSVKTVTAEEWLQLPDDMSTRMVRRVTYGRHESMKGIRARSYLRARLREVTEDDEASLVSQDVSREDTCRLYTYRGCENDIHRSLGNDDEHLYVYGLEYSGYSHMFAVLLGPLSRTSTP